MQPDTPNRYQILGQFTTATIRFVLFAVATVVLVGGPVYHQFLGKEIPLMPQWNTLGQRASSICVMEIRAQNGALLPRKEAFRRKGVTYLQLVETPQTAREQAQQLANLYPQSAPLYLFVAQPDRQGEWQQVIKGEAFHAQ